MEHIFGGLFEVVVAGEGGESNLFGEKIHFEDIAFMKGVCEVALPAAIVFQGRTDVPANLAMFTEGGAGIGGSVGHNLSAHGGKRSAVEIELTEKGGMS